VLPYNSAMTSALRQLAKIADAVAKRGELIDKARREGATWEEIQDALGMSRAGVINLHNKWRKRAPR
jgi:hypothetical protein